MNIYLKYVEVETLLFSGNGYLTGFGPSSTGYQVSDRDKVLYLNKAMLCKWGSFKSANEYISKFLFSNISPKALSKSGVSSEFLRQAGLAGPFAAAMDKEFKKDHHYSDINLRLKEFLSKTGTAVNDVDNIQTWLELMSVTGEWDNVLPGCELR